MGRHYSRNAYQRATCAAALYLVLPLSSTAAVNRIVGSGIVKNRLETSDNSEKTARDLAAAFTKFFVPSEPANFTHKYPKDWTAADMKLLDTRDLNGFRGLLLEEEYAVTDSLLPYNMSREDFYHNIVRELARRDALKEEYTKPLFDTPEQGNQQVTLRRTAYGVQNPVSAEVRELASVVALRDAFVNIITDTANRPYVRIQPDWAEQVGMNPNTALPIGTDVRAYDIGYTIGSMPQYRNKDALSITVASALQPIEAQEKYCSIMERIFQKGTVYLNRDNALSGFVQARIDGRTGFEPVTEHIGLFAECVGTNNLPH